MEMWKFKCGNGGKCGNIKAEVPLVWNRLKTIEMSQKWGITSRRIAVLCEQGRIVGVVKKGKTWLIPYDSEKPEDARKVNHNKRGA